MDFGWPKGRTMIAARVWAPSRGARVARAALAWPPRPGPPALLRRVVQRMRHVRSLRVTETVSSGAGGVTNKVRLSGRELVSSEVYAAGGTQDLTRLPSGKRATRLSFYLPGSHIWAELTVHKGLLRRELIVDPGHRIERRFDY